MIMPSYLILSCYNSDPTLSTISNLFLSPKKMLKEESCHLPSTDLVDCVEPHPFDDQIFHHVVEEDDGDGKQPVGWLLSVECRFLDNDDGDRYDDDRFDDDRFDDDRYMMVIDMMMTQDVNAHLPTMQSIRIPFLPPLSHLMKKLAETSYLPW